MAAKEYRLESDAITAIRRALIVGLTACGEIERLQDEQGRHKIAGGRIPEELDALHPTGTTDVAAQFADALAYLEYARTLDA